MSRQLNEALSARLARDLARRDLARVGEVDLGGQWPVGGVRGEDGGGEPGEKR